MLPLEGLTVVSVEQAVAVPLATRNLADLGARVIKVERPAGGDFARSFDRVVDGTGAHFVWLNRGKESLAIDLKAPEGRDVVRRVIARADVFMQNLAPGAAERLGLGAATLRADHPELVVVNLTGYGLGGPFEQHKAYDMLVQAESGLIAITGTPQTPVKTGVPTADIASGMYCSQAAVAALLRRWRSGEGATIEVSMLEATVEWMGYAMYTQLYTGQPPARMGLSHSSIAPYDGFPTRDGLLLIGVQNDHGWRTLCDALEVPDLADDPRFATNVERVRNRKDCDAAIAARTARFSTEDLSARLAAAGVPAAQIKDVAAVVDHPQLQARGRWRTIATEHAGEIPALLPPATFEDGEAPMGDVPALGRHTRTLLNEFGADADDLIARGIAVG